MLEKLYTKDNTQLLSDIDEIYKKKKYCIVNFLYFANAIQYNLFDLPKYKTHPLNTAYERALHDGDFLLPDGIALQVWYYLSKKLWKKSLSNKSVNHWVNSSIDNLSTQKSSTRIHNLNGTDFTPIALAYFTKKYRVNLFVYSLYDEKIGKWQEWLHKWVQLLSQKYDFASIHSYQSHYTMRGKDYPWDEMSRVIWDCEENTTPPACNIFLTCTWSPAQEIRVQDNLDWFKKHNMLVMNVWWFIDFVSWFEQRAPKRVVKARVLETFWRVASNPKKNFKKFAAMFGIVKVLWRRIKG